MFREENDGTVGEFLKAHPEFCAEKIGCALGHMQKEYGLNSENTQSIGHSEGGTEATVVGIQYGLKTTTFNAYGVGGDYVDKNKNYDDLVTNYRDPHDPVSKLRANIGTTYITPNTQNWFMSTTPFGSVQ